jgi:GNAT superfamily N-acetyltransferase
MEQQEKIIFQNQEVKIVLEESPNLEAIELLQKSVYGTNGPKYIHTGQEIKVPNLKNPLFFRLIQEDKTIGYYCLCKRKMVQSQQKIVGYYGRYLAVEANYQGKKYGKLLKEIAVNFVEQNEKSPYVLYSYIEENNTKSLRISEHKGFHSLATLSTTLFTRISPKKNNRLEKLKVSETDEMVALLENSFKDYTLKNFENINYQNNYFVIRNGGEIVAGLQANPVLWKIVEMQGLGGKIIMNLLPNLPIMKKIFNPNAYDFLAIEGVYFKQGFEHELYPLIEGILNHFSIYSALFQLDTNDSLNNIFKQNGNLGILNAMKKDFKTHVMVKSKGIEKLKNEGEIVYVSSFDFT